jgi:predicted 2-oxoglutarate/Fe(II)-dependent dioxygenase YbiX
MAKLDAPIILDDFLSLSSLHQIEKLARQHKKAASFGVMKAPFDQPVIMPRVKSNRVYHLDPKIEGDWVEEIRQELRHVFRELGFMKDIAWELGVPQLSYYRDGDFYAPHRDSTEYGVTFVYLLGDRNFRGGGLRFKLEGKSKTVRFKPNRAIIFPSHLLHEVTEVKGNGVRISLQFFLTSFSGFQVLKNDLIQRRVDLEPFFKILAGGNSAVEDIVIAKHAVMNFKVSTFEGSFRYIYYKLYDRLPDKLDFRFILQPEFSMMLWSGKKLKVEIKVMEGKVISVYTIGDRDAFVFPFSLTMWEITQELLARKSSNNPPNTR